jgi:ATP-dependent HslUV protease ATP-binding subunit HslU
MSFTATDASGKTVAIDGAYVDEKLGALAVDEDLSRYVL